MTDKRHPHRLMRVLILGLVLCAAGACATGRARPPVELAPLDVPPVPPRAIAPLPQPVAEVPAADLELDPAPIPPAPPQPRAQPAAREAATPAASIEEPAAEAAPEAMLELRLPQGGDDQQVERQIRERLSRAAAMLRQISVASLQAEARAHYDTARRFREQGEEALRVRNYVFASYLADKAETMARELVRR